MKDFQEGAMEDDGLEEDVRRAAELLKRLEEYKPLAKVEELEEANYNIIDNVLNNEKPKKEQERADGRISVKEKLAEKKAALSQEGKPQGRESGQKEPEKKTQREIKGYDLFFIAGIKFYECVLGQEPDTDDRGYSQLCRAFGGRGYAEIITGGYTEAGTYDG